GLCWGSTMAFPRLMGRCALLLLLALLCDAIGLIILILGIFAPLSSWDFFVYAGALVLAFSLLFWVFWYTFNIELPFGELGL
ncbi:TM238 protein, partial [Atlantisia rogersi]|nr:TM238 protein [Atlantisia rogersi]